jgi:hypothetical protein
MLFAAMDHYPLKYFLLEKPLGKARMRMEFLFLDEVDNY